MEITARKLFSHSTNGKPLHSYVYYGLHNTPISVVRLPYIRTNKPNDAKVPTRYSNNVEVKVKETVATGT